MRARTIDGGEVFAGPQSVSVTKTSQAALELAIDEGIARGWKSHKLQGSPEFCEMAIKVARERGITAEIKVTGPKGLFKRPIHVMPNVPPPDPDIVKQITSSTAKEEDPKAAKAAAALAPEDDTDPMGGGMTQQEYIERQNAEKREEEEAQKRKADAEPDGLEM
ncbi:MAG: LPD7 domain-containing protein [Roseibium sp.]|uniref:LPD7 domain-containing protein n=1 Tax=Roseibium sp. TaxID=1936156 RepID=UPI00329A0631